METKKHTDVFSWAECSFSVQMLFFRKLFMKSVLVYDEDV